MKINNSYLKFTKKKFVTVLMLKYHYRCRRRRKKDLTKPNKKSFYFINYYKNTLRIYLKIDFKLTG